MGTGGTTANNWGIIGEYYGSSYNGHGLYADAMNVPYATGADTYVETGADLTNAHKPTLSFDVWCDTPTGS